MGKLLIITIMTIFASVNGYSQTTGLQKKNITIDIYELHELENQLHQHEVSINDKVILEKSLMGQFDDLPSDVVIIPDQPTIEAQAEDVKNVITSSIESNKNVQDILTEYIKTDNNEVTRPRVPTSVQDDISNELLETGN